MELTSFEEYIGRPILQRGRAYFEDGHVESLEEVEKGKWTATVVGSEEYFAEVEINKRGVVSDYRCDCPYDGDLCKHVVAVLCAIISELYLLSNLLYRWVEIEPFIHPFIT